MVLTRKPSVPLTVTMMCACAIVSAAMLLTFASVASADQHGGGSAAATITAASSVSPSASATASTTASATASATVGATSLPTSGGAVFGPTLSLLALLAFFALVVSGVAARVLSRRGDAS